LILKIKVIKDDNVLNNVLIS